MTEKRKKRSWLDEFIDPNRRAEPPKHDEVILTPSLRQFKKKLKAIEPE